MQYAIWRVADKKTVGCLAGRQKLGTHSTLFHAHELWMKVNQATSSISSSNSGVMCSVVTNDVRYFAFEYRNLSAPFIELTVYM